MKKVRATLILTTLIITLQMFNGLLFGSNINLISLPANDIDLSLNKSCVSNATVISDDSTLWNTGASYFPSITVDGSGIVHVVWSDQTYSASEWGNDDEIMYANFNGAGWSNVTVISDDNTLWNTDYSGVTSIAADRFGNLHVVWEDDTDSIGEWGTDMEIMYANYTSSGWSNATVISDIYGWNNGSSEYPCLAVDTIGNVHVVWEDETDSIGEWGTDREIMYANYTSAGWSNATVISDDSTMWNVGSSWNPRIAVNSVGNIYVVWHDSTDGEWGTDYEIMCVNYTEAGWSNATVVSDDSTLWNTGYSGYPCVAVDYNGVVHVVWEDDTDSVAEWGTDYEIMYANYTSAGWSNATVISDDSTMWNDGTSVTPKLAIDNHGNLHVVWGDDTDSAAEWGTDREIMYAKYTSAGWSNATVISDDSTMWNNGNSWNPILALDSNGNVYVVWEDDTDSVAEWGTDREIMYAKISIPSEPGFPLELLLFGLSLSQPGLIRILPLILVGIVVAIAVVIIIVFRKRK